ncbi:hypothetical protein LTR62_003186 [Meristemomyces frigidus]|uniref:Uncharacterized protein n=1 Tax=Meristemomyces frigidus TaxID=1508187 RepID=A0AAN7TS91_9PEZI|nr:hypothetical protein LTR62_003186 [Meristemomyces frigidus]
MEDIYSMAICSVSSPQGKDVLIFAHLFGGTTGVQLSWTQANHIDQVLRRPGLTSFDDMPNKLSKDVGLTQAKHFAAVTRPHGMAVIDTPVSY